MPLCLQVRLIGYCAESFFFLVYEFIENGNLSQHLHGAGIIFFFSFSMYRVQCCIDAFPKLFKLYISMKDKEASRAY
jgi:hypothetical protein